jgi:hypothetical protein
MRRVLSACLPALIALALVLPAQAQEAERNVKPILDLRLRAEQVDQDGLDSTLALTLAGRFGLDAKFGNGWSALVEGEAVGHMTNDFSDTVDTVPGKAVIADPEAFELNRLQVNWKGEKANATLGRQRIIFDDARFVGNVGFRQNEQTFDAVRFGLTSFQNVSLDYVYIDKVQRIFGDESPVGEFESDSHLVRAGFATAIGDFVATGLFLDFDESAAASGQTLALGWSDSWKLETGRVGLNARFAQQSDYAGRGPAQDLGYQSYGASYARADLTLVGGVEILEGAGGRGFATPLATLHAFQGWADVFLNTPAAGIRDSSLGLKGSVAGLVDGAKPASWAVFYHDFDSDNGDLSYGSEFDAVFRMPVKDWLTFEAKGAVFRGSDNGPADRTKFWVALETRF